MNKKILHLATDEKFIDSAHWTFSQAFKDSNDFYVCLFNKENDVEYINNRDHVTFVYYKEFKSKILSIVQDYDLVVLHGLDFIKSQIVLSCPNVKFLWIFWGGEIYNNNKSGLNNILGKDSIKLVPNKGIKGKIRELLRICYYYLRYRIGSSEQAILKASRKIDIFGNLLKEDFDLLLENNILKSNCKFIDFCYYPQEFIFKGMDDDFVNGSNILLGNSSSVTNNHLEAFKVLRKLRLSNKQKVITPLSYGDKSYASFICRRGQDYLSDHFKPLLEFMPLDEYNRIQKSCSYVIMNHYRQQAVGNVLAAIWMGSKVYLDKRNTVYHYLKRIGVEVFDVNDLEIKGLGDVLSKEQINDNRTSIIKQISSDIIIKRLRKQLINE